MKIIKFLKKTFGKLDSEKIEAKKKIVKFHSINAELHKKQNEVNEIKKAASKSIRDLLLPACDELKEKIDILKNVSLENKKEDPRIKHLVILNKKQYILLAEKLVIELEHLGHVDYDNLVLKVNSYFFDFKKKSDVNYHKATYLVGKEIGNVKDSINKLFMEYSKIVKENDKFSDELKFINSLKKKINDFEAENVLCKNIYKDISKLNEDIKRLKHGIKETKSEIENLKNSKEYAENFENIEKFKILKIEYSKELDELKHIVDFKGLLSVFHKNEIYKHLVDNFRQDFKESFEKDKGITLLNLMNDARLTSKKVLDKIRVVNNKSEEIFNMQSRINYNPASELEDKIKHLESEIISCDDEKLKHEKRLEKTERLIHDLRKHIKHDLEKIDLTLED